MPLNFVTKTEASGGLKLSGIFNPVFLVGGGWKRLKDNRLWVDSSDRKEVANELDAQIFSRCKMLRFLQLFALALLTTARETAVTSDDQINCGACKGLFDEVDYLVSKGKQHHSSTVFFAFIFSTSPLIIIPNDAGSFAIVPDYASIDTGSQREWGKDSKKKSFARSEVHLYEVLEVACHEMENYSGFEEQGTV